LAGVAAANRFFSRRLAQHGPLSIGVVALFGWLCIGRFFGGVSTAQAATVLVIPCLCWATEWRPLRGRTAWQTGVIRLLIVALSLSAMLMSAKRDFDRRLGPLMSLPWQPDLPMSILHAP
jgi:hypothetical protein